MTIKCNFCNQPATIDSQILGHHTWANFCDDCAQTYANPQFSTRLKQAKKPTPAKKQKLSYKRWLGELDLFLMNKLGVSYQDIRDIPTRDYYESGLSPTSVGLMMLENELEENELFNE
jgi:hypothetical protein